MLREGPQGQPLVAGQSPKARNAEDGARKCDHPATHQMRPRQDAQQKEPELHDSVLRIRRALPELLSLERYERRALSRFGGTNPTLFRGPKRSRWRRGAVSGVEEGRTRPDISGQRSLAQRGADSRQCRIAQSGMHLRRQVQGGRTQPDSRKRPLRTEKTASVNTQLGVL
jgi:hypothetical protein